MHKAWYQRSNQMAHPGSTIPSGPTASFSHFCRPDDYLDRSFGVALPTQTSTVLQLANLCLLYALNEHFVLSSSNSVFTWRKLLMLPTLFRHCSFSDNSAGWQWDVLASLGMNEGRFKRKWTKVCAACIICFCYSYLLLNFRRFHMYQCFENV